MSEERYTLAEARRMLTEATCADRGHDYQIILAMGNNAPHEVVCLRCGDRWVVAR